MKSFITIFFSLLMHSSFSQESNLILSLPDILSHIQSHSSHLYMYDAEASSLDAASKGAKSWMPPEFSTGFWMTPYNPKYWKGNPSNPGMGQFMISGQQTLPDKKKQDAEQAYLASMSAVSKEQKNARQNELFSEARKNYYQWLVLKKKIAVLNDDIKILEFMTESSEIRYKNGQGKIGAYYKAKASIGSIHNTRILVENEINQKRIALNTLMHMPPQNYFDIDTTFNIKSDLPLDFDTLTLVNNRSDLKALDKQIAVTGLQQNFEKSKLRPEYGIRYDHMFGFGSLPMQFTLMGMVKIPLARWSAKNYHAAIESLQFKIISQQQERQTLINESLGMAYSLKGEVDTKKKQLVLYDKEIIPALKRNYQTSLLAYQQNTEDLFVLYDAWEKLNLIQLEYFDLQQQLITSLVELDKVLENKQP